MRHQDLTLNHILESFTYADKATREAAGGFAAGDVGRIAFQQDTKQYYRLLNTSGGSSGWSLVGPYIPVGALFAILQTVSATPAAITGMTAKMLGLAAIITPAVTGKLLVQVTIGAFYTTPAGNWFSQANLRYATGAAPANGAAVPGGTTQVGPQMQGPTNPQINSMSIAGVVTGLAIGSAYWFDLAVASSNASAIAHADNTTISIVELP